MAYDRTCPVVFRAKFIKTVITTEIMRKKQEHKLLMLFPHYFCGYNGFDNKLGAENSRTSSVKISHCHVPSAWYSKLSFVQWLQQY